ncbi:MAG: hypothetical protein CVU89_13100 [Firmicutes bacterium HGW-Firmicutes-14]|nr:MAG: hypothetical protein CVU89_13100 [Firmicutes bacterium HGW-Firmicutes-14]
MTLLVPPYLMDSAYVWDKSSIYEFPFQDKAVKLSNAAKKDHPTRYGPFLPLTGELPPIKKSANFFYKKK